MTTGSQPPVDSTASPGEPAARNVAAIAELERAALQERSAADRWSARITGITGSMPFAVLHAALFAAWILLNAGAIDGFTPVDPFPFSFLALVVSLEAIFLAVFVLMSQNRMARQADKRAHLNLQVDLLAEQELTTMLRMLYSLCKKHQVDVDISERVRQLLEDTDVHKLASELQERLPER